VSRRRPVAISQLAAYAADPDGFMARRGGPMSARGARYGDRYHDRFGRPSRSSLKRRLAFPAAILIFLILAYLAFRSQLP
jgi:hypothetical protein